MVAFWSTSLLWTSAPVSKTSREPECDSDPEACPAQPPGVARPDRFEVGLRETGKSEEYVDQRAGAALHDVRLVRLEDPHPGRHEHPRRSQVACVGVLQPPDPLDQLCRRT